MNKDIIDKIQPGTKVRVFERVLIDLDSAKGKGKGKEKKDGKAKERISRFEGLVIARKHGNEPGATFTVRGTVAGVGVEKIYPIHSPLINKIDILSTAKKVRRSKLYYLRDLSKKKIRKKLKAEQA